jgi:hypothetical protein
VIKDVPLHRDIAKALEEHGETGYQATDHDRRVLSA